jgi:hypothetical protein
MFDPETKRAASVVQSVLAPTKRAGGPWKRPAAHEMPAGASDVART